MTTKSLIKSIESAIIDFGVLADPEELAFFGLTSKSELQYRDRVALGLYRKLFDKYNVVREWKKCDLAILEKITNKPIALIEFKVCYSCDLYKPSTRKEYVDAIKKDIEKSKLISVSDTEIYSILFVVKPKDIIPNELKDVVKYWPAINAGLNKCGDADIVEILGEDDLGNDFNNLEIKYLRIDKAYGITCGLDYCIITPEDLPQT